MRLLKLFCIFILFLIAVYAQTTRRTKVNARLNPKLINYQGYLTDSLGVPIDDSIDMTFSIYDQTSGGNLLWTEDSSAVPVENGIFNVLLGSIDAIPDTVFADFANCWLELTLESTHTLTPRTRITSVGFAYTATYSDTADYARNAVSGGVPSGYSILGETDVAPMNYTYTGAYVTARDTGIIPDTWTTKTNMPTARSHCVAVEVNGKIYVIGGQGGLQKNEEYDPVSDSWTTKTDMPTGRYAHVAAAVNGKIYVIGGYSGGNLSTVEEYDPVSDSWTTKTAMPTARRFLCAASANGKIYAIGGYTSTYVPTNEEYDPGGDSWATKANMPTARGYLAAASVNGAIYVIGGLGGLNKNEEYNPSTNTWATKANMPSNRESLAAAGLNGKVYVVGGYSGSAMNLNQEYDPLTDAWATKAGMPTARYYLSAAAVNGRVYAIGGNNGGNLNTNEAYGPGEHLFYIHKKN
jgi:N-acetylneuraminic acid mutarotase